MKKFLPFLFPTVAFVIVLLLAFRWYSLRTDRSGTISPFAEGVEIEDLTEPITTGTAGVSDYKTANLTPSGSEGVGQVRYDMEEGKVRMTIMASLPEVSSGFYQVWFKQVDGQSMRKAFRLDLAKGGYMGSAAVSADVLPFEVVISREETDDDQIESITMQGLLPKEN